MPPAAAASPISRDSHTGRHPGWTGAAVAGCRMGRPPIAAQKAGGRRIDAEGGGGRGGPFGGRDLCLFIDAVVAVVFLFFYLWEPIASCLVFFLRNALDSVGRIDRPIDGSILSDPNPKRLLSPSFTTAGDRIESPISRIPLGRIDRSHQGCHGGAALDMGDGGFEGQTARPCGQRLDGLAACFRIGGGGRSLHIGTGRRGLMLKAAEVDTAESNPHPTYQSTPLTEHAGATRGSRSTRSGPDEQRSSQRCFSRALAAWGSTMDLQGQAGVSSERATTMQEPLAVVAAPAAEEGGVALAAAAAATTAVAAGLPEEHLLLACGEEEIAASAACAAWRAVRTCVRIYA